ncbi:NADH dehydrogenase FAD-containing subunit [Stackebrandtia endophytica]|uniref:NADH dehydrogenase FAD-containing subunit n=1 Tax=Stackebrandtia endophytica TaxID=1496996 RepID=A0A543AZ16_9ACTN|nr:FAD-dependent oxidoreductase [Stackebrandtia endophytica]TQL77816.1 NADH dehydrogenase FAD-containing subunit [Stackebrandtia endophytica]
MTATVAIVGGGYGGITAAQALDEDFDVVLIEPKDAFVHNVAALRAVVDPNWAKWMFFPYDGLLKRGRVVRDRAISVEAHGVRTVSGEWIGADYIVIATGTTYPFPAKVYSDHAEAGIARYHRATEALGRAERVLLLGAGPVGIELAGEIRSTWPDKHITLIEPARDILSGGFIEGFDEDVADQLRSELRRQLRDLGISLILGDSLRHDPPTSTGIKSGFAASTWGGTSLTADIWFQCYGRQPVSRVLSRQLSGAWRTDGRLSVMPDLRLPGQSRVFAIGDVTRTQALDTAVVAMEQGGFVAEQIKSLAGGGDPVAYEPSQPLFLIPLGTGGGASYSPDGGILDAETTTLYKGNDLFLTKYCEIFDVPNPLEDS